MSRESRLLVDGSNHELLARLRATEGVDAYVRVVAAAGVITLEKDLVPSGGA